MKKEKHRERSEIVLVPDSHRNMSQNFTRCVVSISFRGGWGGFVGRWVLSYKRGKLQSNCQKLSG